MSSSQLPVRRSTRTRRPVVNDAENATARSKVHPARRGAAAAPASGAGVGVMRATASSIAKAKTLEPASDKLAAAKPRSMGVGEKEVAAAPGKRKREALLDVTEVNKKKAIIAAKGKAKAVDKTTTTTTTTTSSTASSSTTVVKRHTRTTSSELPRRRVLGDLKPPKEEEAKAEVATAVPPSFNQRTAGAGRKQLQVLRDISEEPQVKPKVFSKPSDILAAIKAEDSCQEEELVAAQLAPVAEEEEVIPHDDLDANDWDDPTMCAEYADEIFAYMKKIEVNSLAEANYMDIQPELTWDMREQVMDWLIQVHYRYRFREESLFLCFNLLDRVLYLRQHVSKGKLQLVAVSCFLVSTKFEEGVTPSMADIHVLVGEAYTIEEIQKGERYVLATVGWDLSYPGPMGFLRRGSKADFYDPHSRTIAKYLLEVGFFDHRLVGVRPSKLAAAALWLARLAMGREDWDNNLIFYTTYREEELLPVANLMLNYVAQPAKYDALHAKYAHKALYKVSLRLKSWIKSRWGEEGVIDLIGDLPQMKEEIVKTREEKSGSE